MSIDIDTEELTEIVANSFRRGWVPADVPDEYMDALEFCVMGNDACEEIKDICSQWYQDCYSYSRAADSRAISQIESMRLTLEEAYEQTCTVEEPEHDATAYLLVALREALQALINSCNTVITAIECRNLSTLRKGVRCATKAASVLQVVYNSTH